MIKLVVVVWACEMTCCHTLKASMASHLTDRPFSTLAYTGEKAEDWMSWRSKSGDDLRSQLRTINSISPPLNSNVVSTLEQCQKLSEFRVLKVMNYCSNGSQYSLVNASFVHQAGVDAQPFGEQYLHQAGATDFGILAKIRCKDFLMLWQLRELVARIDRTMCAPGVNFSPPAGGAQCATRFCPFNH